MSNVSKLVYYGETLFDITDTTAEASRVLSGSTFYGADGAKKTGTCTYDSDTTTATALESQILSGATAYARGAELTGTMVNRGSVTGTISTKAGQYTIPAGYHDGGGKVSLSGVSTLLPQNVRQGITILGVEGTLEEGSECIAQTKTVTPSNSIQTVIPDSGFTHLTSVTVNAIPYSSQANSAGGQTVTIG